MKLSPLDQVLWYINRPLCKPATKSVKVDVLVVGGGMAGLSAAQTFHEKGLSVALIEKNYCGAGASGRSSGFITPDSEFSLHNLLEFYGPDQGKNLWEFAVSGVELIHSNIKKYAISCDYQEQDTLVLATSKKSLQNSIEKEYKARADLQYQSNLYSQETLPTIIGSSKYYGGIRYPNTFGICAYQYCQAMKHILLNQGVQIFEDCPATEIISHEVKTPSMHFKAEKIVLCIDRFIRDFGKLLSSVYHVQTFLMMSAPLTIEQTKLLFPEQRMMAWDTDLIYNYFRLDGDNRLMLGGARLLSTYASCEEHKTARVQKKLMNYCKEKFPHIPLHFNYIWPGIIGITKDIMPVAGFDKDNTHIYYVTGAAGLPWAAALGVYSAESMIDKRTDLDDVFSPYRHFTLGSTAQKVLGTKLTFALSNFMRTRSL